MTACYEVVAVGSAHRDARKIDRQHLQRILTEIRSLSEDPFPVASRRLTAGEKGYRLRVDDYRILYEVDTDSKIVTVYHIRHRREAYR